MLIAGLQRNQKVSSKKHSLVKKEKEMHLKRIKIKTNKLLTKIFLKISYKVIQGCKAFIRWPFRPQELVNKYLFIYVLKLFNNSTKPKQH